ncbi:MAG: AMP-binding protein, partial [Anaerolineae bacterium]|nr:AMP-binding protein [Anaerolineae bacterium]
MTDEAFIPSTGEWYYPSEEIVKNAFVQDYDSVYREAMADVEGFWAKRAETLDWYQKWEKVLDSSNAPFYKWFVGGKTNIALNALDRHIKTWRKNKLAIIFEGEKGDKQTLSYWRLWQEVNKFANVLRSMGVKKGDRVTIYMGRIPELVIAMLATAKIGAVHSVVYGGFSENALADRIEDAQSRVLVTCDGAWLRGNIVELKKIADQAVHRSPVVEHVIVVQRTGQEVPMQAGRDFWYHDLMALPIASPICETEVMDAEDPLFILYTSGTTGKPKGILHTHGGYQVYTSTTLEWVFDIRDDDRFWCAADPGWITGHS